MSDDVSYVYFLQVRGGGPVKIGLTYDVRRRLGTIQSWCPFDLDLLAEIEGCGTDESVLLRRFRDHCIRGEWFEPNDDLLRVIATVRETGRYPSDISKLIDARHAEIAAAESRSAAWRAKHGESPSRGEPSLESRQKMRAGRRRAHERQLAAKGSARSINYEHIFRGTGS